MKTLEAQSPERQIRTITIIGLVANIALSIFKFVIGILGGSQAVVADALHSFSDTSSDLVILFGVQYWLAPPDENHPYGHRKIESFVSIVIGMILITVAIGIGYDGILSLLDRRLAKLTWYVMAGPLVSLFTKELLFRKTYEIGVRINSSSLKANAWHHRTDALSSIPVLIAVIATLIDPRLSFLDAIGAIVVSAFIIKVGIDILYSNINDLMDTGMSKERLAGLKTLILSMDNVRGVHKIRTRKMASCIYIDLHLEVDGSLTVTQGHDVSEQVKQTLIRSNPQIIDVLVHLEPEQSSAVNSP